MLYKRLITNIIYTENKKFDYFAAIGTVLKQMAVMRYWRIAINTFRSIKSGIFYNPMCLRFKS